MIMTPKSPDKDNFQLNNNFLNETKKLKESLSRNYNPVDLNKYEYSPIKYKDREERCNYIKINLPLFFFRFY